MNGWCASVWRPRGRCSKRDASRSAVSPSARDSGRRNRCGGTSGCRWECRPRRITRGSGRGVRPSDEPTAAVQPSWPANIAGMSTTLTTTPAADGFRMPGEFEPHSGTWLLWPERTSNWRAGAKPAQAAFAAVATAIATGEPVTVGASRAQFVQARSMLPDAIRVVEMSSDDSWMRDVGPTFVIDGQGAVRGVDWRFNAWGGLSGGLYFPWDQDDLVASKVLEIEGNDRYRALIVNEGGAIHVDGEGTALVTEQVLLNANRNPGVSKDAMERHLKAYLGVQSVIWLGEGVVDDETGGHVDNLACFVRPGAVALHWTDNKRDPQFAVSQDAFERLSAARDARGRRLAVIKLPLPGPL